MPKENESTVKFHTWDWKFSRENFRAITFRENEKN